jgi:hypothetical protein
MNKKAKKSLMFLVFMVAFLASYSICVADIPPPPVDQDIGILDTVFNNLLEADCRLCHENPDQFPVEPESIPNRHHLLVGQPVPDPTARPFPLDNQYRTLRPDHSLMETQTAIMTATPVTSWCGMGQPLCSTHSEIVSIATCRLRPQLSIT